jgi:peptidoglycan hydrolase-like protein with peptidoglycan-binding domain
MLQLGSSGPEVLKLQQALAAAGFDPKGLDGKFGPMTEAALKAFQKAARIVVDGKAGPQTWGALKKWGAAPVPPTSTSSLPSLKQGAKGEHVKLLQTLLERHGLRTGGIDGNFGPATHAAVVKFQLANGLGGSGLVGPQTWALLQKTPQSSPTTPTTPTPSSGSAGIPRMLEWAKSMIGSKYAAVNPFRFGEVPWDGNAHQSVNGSGTVYQFPKGTRVFDCSGFVVTAYKQLGVNLAARGITTSGAIHANTTFLQPVSRENLQPGDLITYNASNGVGHVVIYMGDGKCIEAAGGVGVVIRDVKWDRLKSIRRVPLD